MENASKALIIAAAILISIMIISLGIWVFNMANQATKNVNLDSATVAEFNQQFTQFEGTRESGGKVKSLIDAVRTNNLTHIDDKSMQVSVIYGNTKIEDTDTASNVTNQSNALKNAIQNGSTYKVSFEYAESGLIETITITTNK